MLRLIWYFFFIMSSLIKVIPKKKQVKKLLAEGKTQEAQLLIDTTVKSWSEHILKKGGVTVVSEQRGPLPNGAAVYVCNHEGDFDIPAVISHIAPMAFVAKIEMHKVPMLRDWMDFLGCIYVDRNRNRKKSLKNKKPVGSVVDQAVAVLLQGKPVVIFPEGTRSRGKEMGKFKSGAFRMAILSGAPIVPVRLEGASKIYEQNTAALKKGEVRMTIFPSINTSELIDADRPGLTSRVREIIEKG